MIVPIEREQAGTATIEFRFLGSFAVRSGGCWHSGPAPKKGGGLIQYLGIYPRRVATRDEIANAFWPGLQLDEVEHRIHLAASGARVFLRRLFGGVDPLQCVGSGYTWRPSVRVISDADRFLECTRRGTIESLRAAVDLYAGDFLAGETADWLQPMRVKMASARACALEAIVEELLARGQYAAALSFGLDLVSAERGHENGTRLVMRCFAALGQRTRAMQQYDLLTAYLAEQIGVEPTRETMELAGRIVAGEVA
jgi:DNA-binding SARP family transcriptional activator